MLGQTVSHYRILEHLGSGGMGVVYRAEDLRLGRPVVLKFLSPGLSDDPHAVDRLRREARAASALNHPNISTIYDVDEHDGQHFIVMELLEGRTLRDVIGVQPLDTARLVDVALQIADGLDAAHRQGITHRDVKPANVFVTNRGVAKILDFGLAKVAPLDDSRPTMTDRQSSAPGVMMGTLAYMSPEQARGDAVSAQSDLFSFGAVMYEMATGRLPFGGSSLATTFDAILNRDPPAVDRLNPDVPPGLAGIIRKALEKERDLRYQSAADMRADLLRVAREVGVRHASSGTVVSGPGSGGGTRHPSRWTLAFVAAGVLALAAAVVFAPRLLRGGRAGDVQTSVAVLPFDNVGAGSDIDYLRLALADEVATAMSYAPSLAVRPVASSRRLLGTSMSPQQAGRELRAARVVTGHFTRQASELHVTLEAVDVEGDRVVWRDTIAAPASDAIALRERLTSKIRDALLPALSSGPAATARNRPRNAEAYAIYLKSLALSTDAAPNRAAIAMVEQVTRLDPEFANGWASLASRYYQDGHYAGGGPEALRRSEVAAQQALELDPNHILAAVGLLHLQVEAGRLSDAYDSSTKLVESRPDSGEAHAALAYVLRYAGLLEESARECERALALDPGNALFRSCANPFMLLGRYERALDFVRLDGSSDWATFVSRVVYQRMGRRDEARDQHARLRPDYLLRMAPESYHGFLTRCLAGSQPEAQEPLSENDVRAFFLAREDPEPLYFWACDLAACGQPAPALKLLRESIRRNYCAYPAVEIDPALAAIRTSPEYTEVLAAARRCRTAFDEHVASKARTRTRSERGSQ